MRSATPSRPNTLTHLTAVVVVSGCLALGWWQLTRALAGNTLSWAYVFEWPIFAGYAVFMWWRLIHDHSPDEVTGAGPSPHPDTDSGERESQDDLEEDEELASYNRYLAALNASGKRKRW